MIQQLRQHIETAIGVPIHYVLVTEQESFPCGAIRLRSDDHKQTLQRSNGFRTSMVEVAIYADNYAALDTLGEQLAMTIDGQTVALDDGECRIVVEDADDSATPSPFGNDDFLFFRTYELRVHQKRS